MTDSSTPDIANTASESEASHEKTMRDLHTVLLETEVREGKMVCGNCRHEYRIKEGIANFLLPSHLGQFPRHLDLCSRVGLQGCAPFPLHSQADLCKVSWLIHCSLVENAQVSRALVRIVCPTNSCRRKVKSRSTDPRPEQVMKTDDLAEWSPLAMLR